MGFEMLSPLLPSEMGPSLEGVLRALDGVSEAGRHAHVEALVAAARAHAGFVDKLRGRATERFEAARAALPAERFSGRSADGRVRVTLDGRFGFVALALEQGTPVDAALQGAQAAHAAARREAERAWQVQLEGASGEAGARPGGAPEPS